jgi:protein-S-isoprenylcysteine O-methyltransferase Ste14
MAPGLHDIRKGDLCMVKIISLPSRQRRHHWSDWVGFVFCVWLVITVLRRSPMLGMLMLPVCLHDIVAGVAFLVRRPAKAHLQGWGPRIATYASTFVIPAFLALAGSRHPSWVRFTPAAWAVSVGYALWMAGILAAVWTVWQLRYSFSLAPQARELVRTGPYRVARHPIYAAYLLQYLGIWFGHLTLSFGIAVLAWLGLIAARIHYEEMVLESTFSQYAEYRQQVGMFGPRLRPGASRAPELAQRASTETLTKRALASPLPAGGCPVGPAVTAPKTTWLKNY